MLLVTVLLLLVLPNSATAAGSAYLGPDELIFWGSAMDSLDAWTSLECDRNGVFYAAVSDFDGVAHRIWIHRSEDDGVTWMPFANLSSGSASPDYVHPVLRVTHLPDGTPERLFCGYVERDNLLGTRTIAVAYVELSGLPPGWETRQLTELGSHVTGFDFVATDRFEYPYAVLVAASQPSTIAPQGIRMVRSSNQGHTWGVGYDVAVSPPGYEYRGPRLALGTGSLLHLAWSSHPQVGGPGGNVETLYSRALNLAANGFLNWQGVLAVSNPSNGADEVLSSITAGHSTNHVLLSMDYGDSPGSVSRTTIRHSSDQGVTWAGTDSTSVAGVVSTELIDRVGGNFALAGFDIASARVGFSEAADTAPLSWSGLTPLSDAHAYETGHSLVPHPDLAASPRFNDQLGFLWHTNRPTAPKADSLFFDSEWFAEPGFPRPEFRIPVWLQYRPTTNPILAEVDGDPELEIVFADEDYSVRVLDPDGSDASGWPQHLGSLEHCGSVAVGDIDGDGASEVVAGGLGKVFAFEGNGMDAVGYPVDLGVGALETFVVLAPILDSDSLQVVAVSGNQIHALAFGQNMPGFPIIKSGNINLVPAVGDLDGDGFNEIITLPGFSEIHADRRDGTSLFVRSFPSLYPVSHPTLADIDLDGDREVVIPVLDDVTAEGYIYVLDETGADVPPWPIGPLAHITSVTPVDMTGDPCPELVVGFDGQAISAFGLDGFELPGWPREFSLSPHGEAPGIDVIDEGNPDVLVGSYDDSVFAFTHLGNAVPGWPRGIWGPSLYVPASGDIDVDGSLEIVFLTHEYLFMFDVNAAPTTNAEWRWPMFGYDPQQTNCLNCSIPTSVIGVPVGDVTPPREHLGAPVPNPTFAGTRVLLRVEADARATLTVHDSAGRLVRTLVRGLWGAGEFEVEWNGIDEDERPVAAGVYFLRLAIQQPDGIRKESQKLVVLRGSER